MIRVFQFGSPRGTLLLVCTVALLLAYTAVFSLHRHDNFQNGTYIRQLQELGDLPRLTGFGGEPDPSLFPLQVCQGDCDSDSDCDTGLICFQREDYDAVPGCLGGESFGAVTDFCIIDPDAPVTEAPTISPAPSQAPTMSAQPSISAAPTRDEPEAEWVGNDGDPPELFPLQRCQADCDYDSECDWGLYCYQRDDAYDPIPGCYFDPPNTWLANSDICLPKPSLLPGAFRLRLYWEEGYVWQDSYEEFFWCATTEFNGWPGTGNCWYGNVTLDCRSDQMYLARCSGTGLTPEQQAFRFLPISGSNESEVLIQVANVEDQRCFERLKREIYLTECNATNPLQRWFASNGTSFYDDENKFEISQLDFTRQCLSNDHHPKPGEVLEMHSCRALRSEESQTALWERY